MHHSPNNWALCSGSPSSRQAGSEVVAKGRNYITPVQEGLEGPTASGIIYLISNREVE